MTTYAKIIESDYTITNVPQLNGSITHSVKLKLSYLKDYMRTCNVKNADYLEFVSWHKN